ncbi:MAG: acyltransferase, partial [Actinomycetota bacterium]|nr:acyltransferase [Actinomycetota bacterium]
GLNARSGLRGPNAKTQHPGGLVLPLLGVSAGSALLMALLHQPYSDPSRVYYGTDTRAAPLLIGAALACATVRWQSINELHRRGRWALELLGVLGLAALVWAVSQVDEFDPALYQGGFLGVAVAAAAVVASAARPGARGALTVVLGSRPLVWLGRRSYAIYLWFWPVLMLTRPQLDVPLSGLPLLALRVALTVGLAALSYRFVERPARLGALGRVWADLRRARQERAPLHRPSAAWGLGLAVALICVGTGVAVSRPPAEAALNLNRRAAQELEVILQATRATTTLPPTTEPTTVPDTTAALETTTTGPPAPTLTTPPPLPVLTARVSAVGDSVLLGVKPLLERQVEGIVVDADIGRQTADVLAVARALREAGALGEAVILQTGNNGPISPAEFEELLEVFRDVRKVLVVNVKVDRAWEGHNNHLMAAAVPRWSNAVLVDWHAAASKTADAFYDDGLHLTPSGMTLFAQLVLSALQ